MTDPEVDRQFADIASTLVKPRTDSALTRVLGMSMFLASVLLSWAVVFGSAAAIKFCGAYLGLWG